MVFQAFPSNGGLIGFLNRSIVRGVVVFYSTAIINSFLVVEVSLMWLAHIFAQRIPFLSDELPWISYLFLAIAVKCNFWCLIDSNQSRYNVILILTNNLPVNVRRFLTFNWLCTFAKSNNWANRNLRKCAEFILDLRLMKHNRPWKFYSVD